MSAVVNELMRVQIWTRSKGDQDVCDEFLKKTSAKVEETTDDMILAHISPEDFQTLKDKNIAMVKIEPIPSKTDLSFQIPSVKTKYAVFIPYLPVEGPKKIEETGAELLEVLEPEKYLMYLTAEQVKKVYFLPFVHSVSLLQSGYERDKIKADMDLRSKSGQLVKIECQFLKGTEKSVMDFFSSEEKKGQCVLLNPPRSGFVVLATNNIDVCDQLAALSNVQKIHIQSAPKMI